MTKLVIAGAAGRMGQTLIRCAQKINDLQVVGATEYSEHPDLGKDAGVVAGIDNIGVALTADLASVLPDCDVMIDFTLHAAVPINATLAAEAGRAIIIGATGLDKEETAIVESAGNKVPIVWAPNMSLGVNFIFATLKKAAAILTPDYNIEIDETHHVHKKDAPSGTALQLGKQVAEGLNADFEDIYLHDPNGESNIRDPNKIVIRSHREGEVVGAHTVSFENNGEKIEFTHHAWSREAFANGALRAAQWVADRKPRIYNMQDVLDL
ncbi:MAG: 4-hydroxy-tetrahydrodipicolinate reductase [Kiritimatiellae bacterium]|nr:4-hydroxy-tetrahydrodipicolinate reductase [Kiritimatiellia bacterium]